MKKKKQKQQSEFWKKIHFKYRISAINENTLEEVWKIKTSIFFAAGLFLIVAFLLVTITSIIIITTPIRYYLPGYLDVEIREKAVKTAIKVDSLEQTIRFQDAYINNIKQILTGTLEIDSVTKPDSVYISEYDPILEKSEREKEFVTQYEETEKYTLGVFPTTTTTNRGIFFRPVKGVVTQHFNQHKKIYQVIVKTAKTENVLATLDGTVIFTGYDINDKYIIHIQHKNGYISIYQGCTQIVKKTGDIVAAGEAIGVIVSTKTSKEEGEEERGGSLKFELWNKGVPVNPETFITF